jgi:hypothetical protein
MFVFSASLAVLGAACTAEVEDPTNTLDPAVAAEESAAVGAEPLADNSDRNRDRSYCEKRCRREYRDCMGGYDRDHDRNGDRRRERCRRRYSRCMDKCDYRR